MRNKITVVIVFLLLFQSAAYGNPPSALDIYTQIIPLHPGADVQVAYDTLGLPHERTERILMIPSTLRWYITTDITITVYLRENSTINFSAYSETYNQMEPAHQRYKELKESFNEILGIDVPFEEFEHGVARLVGNFLFGVGHKKVSSPLGPKYRITIVFVE